jgi:hypothetical protein
VTASVSCDTWSLLSGRVNGAKVYGEGWRSPLDLTARILEVGGGGWPQQLSTCGMGRGGAVGWGPHFMAHAAERILAVIGTHRGTASGCIPLADKTCEHVSVVFAAPHTFMGICCCHCCSAAAGVSG